MSSASFVGFDLFGISGLLKCMLLRIRCESPFALDRTLDFLRRNQSLFDYSVGNHCSDCPMEEIQHSIINPLQTGTELVDGVAQEVGLRPPQLVAQLSKP